MLSLTVSSHQVVTFSPVTGDTGDKTQKTAFDGRAAANVDSDLPLSHAHHVS